MEDCIMADLIFNECMQFQISATERESLYRKLIDSIMQILIHYDHSLTKDAKLPRWRKA